MGYLKDNADILYVSLYDCAQAGAQAGAYLKIAANYLKSENFDSAGDHLILAGDELQYAFQYLWNAAPKELLNWYWTENNWGAEYELTWQKICIAWAKDDFAGRGLTIGFIDRMRQLLWDEPYYIAFAAKPENVEL